MERGGIEPSASEVVVEPATRSLAAAPESTGVASADLSAPVDLTAHDGLTSHGNGTHTVEPVEPDVSSESVRHG
jgi:hypothetical protein